MPIVSSASIAVGLGIMWTEELSNRISRITRIVHMMKCGVETVKDGCLMMHHYQSITIRKFTHIFAVKTPKHRVEFVNLAQNLEAFISIGVEDCLCYHMRKTMHCR